ncbi:MAG: rhomboid family intramembrane serine protease [Planctomycetota bacterium]
MRRIGTLTDPTQARRFADFLLTQSIQCSLEIEQKDEHLAECDVWIRDEEDVEKSRQLLAEFREAPDSDRYEVQGEAEKLRRESEEDEKRRKSMQRKVKHRSGPSSGGVLAGLSLKQQSIPVVIAVLVLSIVASFATDFGNLKNSRVPGQASGQEWVFDKLSFVDAQDYFVSRNDPLASIKKGEVWRIVTPMFLHGNMMHLAFNMIALFMLGSAIERLQGSTFLINLLLFSEIIGNAFQIYLPPAEDLPPILAGLGGYPFSIGASGAVYGLFGYLWIRPMLSFEFPIRMMPQNVVMMLGWLVLCIFFVNGIANGAHIGGLIGGVIAALLVAKLKVDRFA